DALPYFGQVCLRFFLITREAKEANHQMIASIFKRSAATCAVLVAGLFVTASAITPVYVSETGDNANDGSTPALAKATLYNGSDGAVDVVDSGGEVIILAGTISQSTSVS